MTESVETRHTNRLVHETSPYLLQHAHNPVDWYPWGEEALARARAEQKPIFVSIGYSACHWCHVMERESFEDPDVAELLREHFISIKVDREERPDLDDVYMTAVQVLTGRGGWPLSVFLTPDLKPFYGGTYFPIEDRYGMPGFKRLLVALAEVWETRRDDILSSAAEISLALEEHARVRDAANSDMTKDVLASAARRLLESFDAEWGGFGSPPKFPQAGHLSYLLRHYQHTGDEQALHAVLVSLDRMAAGGMYDQLGGGFHRYSVDREWLVPHFEKMLYDNALLSMAYLEAYQLTGNEASRRVVEETLGWILREMTDPSGGFYAAQDADSEGAEGKYYTWDLDEIRQVLGPAEAEFFAAFYGVTPGGNFDGRNILHVPVSAEDFAAERGLPAADLWKRLDAARAGLLAVRASRVPPLTDTKILADWNGMMISAFARAWQVLGVERYREAAERAGRFVLSDMMRDDRLHHVHAAGRAKVEGYLDDYAHAVNAMIDLYESTFDLKWLEAAARLASVMTAEFWDESGGGFYFASAGRTDLIVRQKPFVDGSVPSGNASAALALLRLGKLLDRADFAEKAETLLRLGASVVREAPQAAAHLLQAMDFQLYPPAEIAIVGRRGSSDARALLEVVHGRFLPNRIVVFLDPEEPGAGLARETIPLLREKTMISGRAAAYVCEDFACRRPVTEALELRQQLGPRTRATMNE